MNPFKSRSRLGKLSHERHHTSEQNLDAIPEQTPVKSRVFAKKKKQQIQSHNQVDLIDVLPPVDDFRTSLLLPKLSARFSMLRNLDDIAGSEPAQDHQGAVPITNSYFRQAGVEGPFVGKIMDRAKPRKGNRLFGGRQKVYKTGNREGNNREGNYTGFGRAFYEDDVHVPVFSPRPRKRRNPVGKCNEAALRPATPQRAAVECSQGSPLAHESASPLSLGSPTTGQLLGGMENVVQPTAGFLRQSPEKLGRKRMYELYLDRHILKHQSSVRGRLEFGQAGGICPPKNLNNSKSTSDLGDRLKTLAIQSVRCASTGTSPTIEGRSHIRRTEDKPVSNSSTVSTPNLSAGFEIAPQDIGKATASGAFQRPKVPYNEKEFAERQAQLQEGKKIPLPTTSPICQHRHERIGTLEDCGVEKTYCGNSPSPNRHFKIRGAAQLGQSIASCTSQISAFNEIALTSALLPVDLNRLPMNDTAAGDDRSRPSIFEPGQYRSQQTGEFDQLHLYKPHTTGDWTQYQGHSKIRPRKQAYHDSEASFSETGLLPSLGFTVEFESDAELGDMVRRHLRSKSNASSVYPPSLADEDQPPALPGRASRLAPPFGS